MQSNQRTVSGSVYGDSVDSSYNLDTYPVSDDLDLVYSSVLKIVLFEYVNEPRFRRKWKRIENSEGILEPQRPHLRSANKESNRISTWFSHDSDGSDDDLGRKAESMKQTIDRLEHKLTRVAMNQDVIVDSMLRRSLLKFYNDAFLDVQFRKQTLDAMTKPEDLIVLFVKSANQELVKMDVEDSKSSQLFTQMSRFIDIITEVSRDTTMGPTYANQLKAYKKSLNQEDTRNMTKESPSPMRPLPASQMEDITLKPTFRLDEITHVRILSTLFKVDELKLQRDVIKISSLVKNDMYLRELSTVCASCSYSERDFNDGQSFVNWKQHQELRIQELKAKIQQGCSGHNESGKEELLNVESKMIPDNKRLVLRTLICQILKNDFKVEDSQKEDSRVASKSISLDSKFLLSRCVKYWLMEYGSVMFTEAVTGCLHAMKGIPLTDALALVQYTFRFMEIRLSTEFSAQQTDSRTWCREDQNQWECNLASIFVWLTEEVKVLIKSLFNQYGNNPADSEHNTTQSFLKQAVSTYLALIDQDDVLRDRGFTKTELYRGQMAGLKKATFHAIEKRYIALIKKVPTNKEISIKHLHTLSSDILDDIELAKKRYKVLLKISARYNFYHVLTKTYVTALFRDLPVLMQRIKKYNTPNETDAIDTYQILNELRMHYEAHVSHASDGNLKDSHDASSFPVLESLFFEYLVLFCRNTSNVMKQGYERIVAQENWEPMDQDAEQWYSRSAFDVSRLVSDSLKLVEQLQWQDKTQADAACVILLETASECIIQYTKTMEDIIREDVCAMDEESMLDTDHNRTMTLFKEMKTAIQSSKLWNSHLRIKTNHQIATVGAEDDSNPSYVISLKSCVCMNNMESLIETLNDMEKRFHVTSDMKAGTSSKLSEIKAQLWTIVPVAAEGVGPMDLNANSNSNTGTSSSSTARNGKGRIKTDTAGRIWYSVSIVDTTRRSEIYRTLAASAPRWWDEEEFDLELQPREKMSLSLILWQEDEGGVGHGSRKPGLVSSKRTGTPVGRCYLDLDMKRFKDATSTAVSLSLPLDTHGHLVVSVSLEVERAEPRSILETTRKMVSRSMSRTLKQVSNRFEPCICNTLSIKTLRTVQPNAAAKTLPDADVVYDSLVPLFDFLNENFTVLAQTLSRETLHRIQLQVWNKVVAAADALLLPPLQNISLTSVATAQNPQSSTSAASVWDAALSGFQRVMLHKLDHISGSPGHVRTQTEVDTVFRWVEILCKDFFHNNGAGPALPQLKNEHYQNLTLIASMFEHNTHQLKQYLTNDARAESQLKPPPPHMVALRILWSRGERSFVSEYLQSRGESVRAAVAKLRITSRG